MSSTTLTSSDAILAGLAASCVPVYEYILGVAAENLDNDALLVVRDSGSEEDAQLNIVTWRQLTSAVHSRATELVKLTGFSPRILGDAPFVVGLLGHNGHQYLLTWLALFVLRWTPILLSPQNSSEAILHLLSSTNGSCLLLDQALESRYKDLPADSASFKLTILPAFGLVSIQGEDKRQTEALLQHIELIKRGENADALREEAQRICMYMHTSGSTGHPKAIPWTPRFVIENIMQVKRDYPNGKGRLMYTPLPICHGGGFSLSLPVMAGYGGVITMFEPYRAVSSDSVLRHLRILRNKEPDILLVPSLLEDIVDTLELAEALDYLRIPNTVLQGGAPLRKDVGDKLAHGGVPLVTWGGITEAGVFASQLFDKSRDPADWQYIKLVDSYIFNFTPFDPSYPEHGYQLVMSPKFVTPPIINHEDPRGFLTPDVWERHPIRSDLWKISGRLDDIVVLSNGEKANGKQIENLLLDSPYISHAVIFGAGRFLCGALVRPSTAYRFSANDEEAKHAYLAQIWSYIDVHVNRIVPRHSRLLRQLVVVEDPIQPFQFSDKGTIKKKTTLDLYYEPIERAYRMVEEGNFTSSSSSSTRFSDIATMTGLVRALVTECLGRSIPDEADFFSAGLDSLLAVRLRFSIVSAFQAAKVVCEIPRNIIYAHPAMNTLASYLWSLMEGHQVVSTDQSWSTPHDEEAVVARLVDEAVAQLSTSFPTRALIFTQTAPEGEVYIVTGTTGSLGSAFLFHLLQQPASEIRKVYLLNRTTSKGTVLQRHQHSFLERGLDFAVLESAVRSGRAVLVDTDVTREKLGISAGTYAEMASTATRIVHNAWPVTFTYHFQSFLPHLRGVRALIDLALASPRAVPPHLTFISSISVAGRLPSSSGEAVVPESPMQYTAYALPHGYALSKFAAEKILEKATSTTTLRASIVRSGQIAGSLVTGAWHRHEYMPAIWRASVHVGRVPEDLYSRPPHWLPLEHASQALYALTQAQKSHTSPLTFYGFENTRPVPWTSVVSSLFSLYPSLHESPTPEWIHYVRTLQEDRKESKDSLIDSALLDYIEDFVSHQSMPRLATDNLQHVSSEVAQLISYDYTDAVMEKYIRYAMQG